jgi:hypothetical protein
MTPLDFKRNWKYKELPLSPISLTRIKRFNLRPSTKEFLTLAGLPVTASPFLSFANDTDDYIDGIGRLSERCEGVDSSFDKYIVIGACCDGDPIAINELHDDRIFWLDDEDNFNPFFFNTSINALANFLTIYKDFEVSVLKEHGDEGYRKGYFTDVQFQRMKEGMEQSDIDAVNKEGFWKFELEDLMSNRNDYMNNLR